MLYMAYIPKEIVAEARKIDLLTYLKNYEPSELIEVCRGTYSTKSHDSLKISNGLWYWFTKQVGGKNAIDYLMQVRNYSFTDAVQTVMGNIKVQAPIIYKQKEKSKDRKLDLPLKASNNNIAINYLLSRGIEKEIIQFCIERNLLYEEHKNHNVVFVGYDEKQIPRYAFCRATNEERFMREATGSDKKYSFKINSQKENNILHVFESSIDLLSFATLLKLSSRNWKEENMLSLGGIYTSNYDINKSKIPVALVEFLEKNPNINEIHLHLDRDLAGRNATTFLQQVLNEKYKVLDSTVPFGKDMNEFLCLKKQTQKIEKERTR